MNKRLVFFAAIGCLSFFNWGRDESPNLMNRYYEWSDGSGTVVLSRTGPHADIDPTWAARSQGSRVLYSRGDGRNPELQETRPAALEPSLIDTYFSRDNLGLQMDRFSDPLYEAEVPLNQKILEIHRLCGDEGEEGAQDESKIAVLKELGVTRERYLEAIAWSLLREFLPANVRLRGERPEGVGVHGWSWIPAIKKIIDERHPVFFHGPTQTLADGDAWLHRVSFKPRRRVATRYSEWQVFEFRLRNASGGLEILSSRPLDSNPDADENPSSR